MRRALCRLPKSFVCRHNTGRSQMAEAFLRRFAGDAQVDGLPVRLPVSAQARDQRSNRLPVSTHILLPLAQPSSPITTKPTANMKHIFCLRSFHMIILAGTCSRSSDSAALRSGPAEDADGRHRLQRQLLDMHVVKARLGKFGG